MTFKKGQTSFNKGKKVTEETRRKLRESHLGQIPWNKDMRGLPPHSKEHKRKVSEKLKGRKLSEENRRNLSINRIGMKFTDEHKRNISLGKKGNIPWNKNLSWSKEVKEKISNSKRGKKYPKEEYPNGGWRGKHLSEETKLKLRLAMIKYIREVCGELNPMIGHNEKQILDKLENELNYKILRQYEVEGYFLDGYIPEINLAIEVDEKPKNKEKDIEREKTIRNKLGCEFMRIKDYD